MLGNIGELSCFPLDEAKKYCCATTMKSGSSSRNGQVRKLKLERGNCEVNRVSPCKVAVRSNCEVFNIHYVPLNYLKERKETEVEGPTPASFSSKINYSYYFPLCTIRNFFARVNLRIPKINRSHSFFYEKFHSFLMKFQSVSLLQKYTQFFL